MLVYGEQKDVDDAEGRNVVRVYNGGEAVLAVLRREGRVVRITWHMPHSRQLWTYKSSALVVARRQPRL